MTHVARKIRLWLTLALGTAALVFASSAQAMYPPETFAGSAPGTKTAAVSGPGGFDWANLAIGAAVAVGLAVLALTVVAVARGRNRLAPSH